MFPSDPHIPVPTTTPGPATAQVDGGWAQAWNWITGHNTALFAALVATVLVLWFLTRKAKKIAGSDQPDRALSRIGMAIGMGWSGEATWVIGTHLLHIPWQVVLLLLFVLETNLAVAMIRAERHHRDHATPGDYGTTAWLIAGAMALIAAFASHSLAEVALRLAIPLLVTKTWWDGMVGSVGASMGGGTLRWTPRRLALWLGIIEPGERDVETVHRDRLTRQMTRLYYLKLYGWKKLSRRRGARLAKLTLVADDAIIVEVMRRVRRTGWTDAKLLEYSATHLMAQSAAPDEAAPLDGETAQFGARHDAATGAGVAQGSKASNNRVTVPPTRRVKGASGAATSGDADGADPATLAAHLVMTQQIPIREAARQVPGASEATVRRRVDKLRDATGGAVDGAAGERAISAPDLPVPEPVAAVTHGVNGYHPTLSEETR